MGREEAVDLLRIDRTARADEVVDRPLGREAQRNADVAELEIEIDEDGLRAAKRERNREIGGRDALAGSALRPEHADHRLSGCPEIAAASPCEHLVECESHLVR